MERSERCLSIDEAFRLGNCFVPNSYDFLTSDRFDYLEQFLRSLLVFWHDLSIFVPTDNSGEVAPLLNPCGSGTQMRWGHLVRSATSLSSSFVLAWLIV